MRTSLQKLGIITATALIVAGTSITFPTSADARWGGGWHGGGWHGGGWHGGHGGWGWGGFGVGLGTGLLVGAATAPYYGGYYGSAVTMVGHTATDIPRSTPTATDLRRTMRTMKNHMTRGTTATVAHM